MKYLRPLLPIMLGFQSIQEEQTFAFLHTKPKQLFQSSDQLCVLKATPVGDSHRSGGTTKALKSLGESFQGG